MAMTARTEERGQLLFVLAIFISLTIIGSVVLLNAFHAPADVGATTERTGLDAAEDTSQQVSSDLHDLYMQTATANGEPVPVLNTTAGEHKEFATLVENYTNASLATSMRYESGLINVTFDPEASEDEGVVLRQNNSAPLNDGAGNNHWVVVENADAVPYVYLNVTKVETNPGPGGMFTMHMNSPSANDPDNAEYNLTVLENTTTTGADIFVNGQQVCREALAVPFEVELTSDGVDVGQARRCSHGNSPTYGSFNVDNLNIDQGAKRVEGNYSVVATGGSVTSPDFDDSVSGRKKLKNDFIYNPHFRLRYESPGVQYQANVTALGGG